MADYYTPNDQRRNDAQRLDYDTGARGSGWIWGGILAVALVALIALGVSGGGESVPATGGDAPAAMAPAPADTGSIDAPAPAAGDAVAPAADAVAPAAGDTAAPSGN